jgi:hypothetical protein
MEDRPSEKVVDKQTDAERALVVGLIDFQLKRISSRQTAPPRCSHGPATLSRDGPTGMCRRLSTLIWEKGAIAKQSQETL